MNPVPKLYSIALGLAFILASTSPPPVAAELEQWTDSGPRIQRTVTAKSKGEIDIRVSAGRLTLVGEPRSDAEIQGSLGADVRELRILKDERYLRFHTVAPPAPHASPLNLDSHLTLRAPEGSSLNIEMMAGELRVEGFLGTVTVRSGSAQTDVLGSPRRLQITTITGDIGVAVDTPDAELKTVSGTLRADGRFDSLAAETVSSPLYVSAVIGVEGRLRSVTGNVTLNKEPATTARVRFETSSGPVHLGIPPNLKGRFDFDTSAEQPTPPAPGITWNPQAGRHLARWGSGEAPRHISVRTFDGPIRFTSGDGAN